MGHRTPLVVGFALLTTVGGCYNPDSVVEPFLKANEENRRRLEAWDVSAHYAPTPERQRFIDLVSRTDVGDSFSKFLAQVPRPDVRIVNTAAYGNLRSMILDYGEWRSPQYVTIQYQGDTIVGIDRGSIPGPK